MALLPSGPGSIALVLIITGWPWVPGVAERGDVLRSRSYIEAARLTGDGGISIIFIHLVPNMASSSEYLCRYPTSMVGAQVGLEFLGFGDPGTVTDKSWATNDQSLLGAGGSLSTGSDFTTRIGDARLRSMRTRPVACSAQILPRTDRVASDLDTVVSEVKP